MNFKGNMSYHNSSSLRTNNFCLHVCIQVVMLNCIFTFSIMNTEYAEFNGVWDGKGGGSGRNGYCVLYQRAGNELAGVTVKPGLYLPADTGTFVDFLCLLVRSLNAQYCGLLIYI